MTHPRTSWSTPKAESGPASSTAASFGSHPRAARRRWSATPAADRSACTWHATADCSSATARAASSRSTPAAECCSRWSSTSTAGTCNLLNVTETADGTIYFTESTSAFTYQHFKGAVLEARGRGGLFRRCTDGTVSTMLDGLYFTNGVTPTADGSALVFAETLARRLSKYWLTGPQAGQVTPLVTGLPGHPDNLSTGADGRIWCAMVSRSTPPPSGWRPARRCCADSSGGCRAVRCSARARGVGGGVRSGRRHTRRRAGTDHPDFGMVTGLVEAGDGLWLGCIGSAAVAHVPLDQLSL